MSGGDPGQMTSQGGHYNPALQDGNFYNQAPVDGQHWHNSQQPAGGQPMFLNPNEFQNSQPAIYDPYSPEVAPPPQPQQDPIIQGGQPGKGFASPQENQQSYGETYQTDGQSYGSGQYVGSQWNNSQPSNGQQAQQPWTRPLNGTNYQEQASTTPQSWNPDLVSTQQPFTNYEHNQPVVMQGNPIQSYENHQQQQFGQPAHNYGNYAYSDDNDSHKGFGSFFHGDDSDLLVSSGTPSLATSERHTPDPAADFNTPDKLIQSGASHIATDQSQAKDVLNGAQGHAQPYHGYPGGEPDQFSLNQHEPSAVISDQSQISYMYQSNTAFSLEQGTDQVSNLNPTHQTYEEKQMISDHNPSESQIVDQNSSEPNENQSERRTDHPAITRQENTSLDQLNPYHSVQHDAALTSSPVPSSDTGFLSGVSDTTNLGRTDQPAEDQLSCHSENSSVHGASVGSHSQPPSTSTSRSNSLLGDQSGTGRPSPSLVFQDPNRGSGSPRVGVGSPALSQENVKALHQPPVLPSEGPAVTADLPSKVESEHQVQPPNPAVLPTKQTTKESAQVEKTVPQDSMYDPNQGMQSQHNNQPQTLDLPSQQTLTKAPVLPTTGGAMDPKSMNLAVDSQLGTTVQTEKKESHPDPPSGTAPTTLPPTGPQHIPQGPKELSPTDEQIPSTHPSAFRSVQRSIQPRTCMTSVNPSPPLWSAEVPPMPVNILLAPAAPPTASLVQPVRLSTPQDPSSVSLAASVASVSVPSLPAEAVCLIGQAHAAVVHPQQETQPLVVSNQTQPQVNLPSQTSSSSTQAQDISQVTQNLSNLNLALTTNPLLTQPLPPVPVLPTLQTSPSAPLPSKAPEPVAQTASAPYVPLPAVTAAAPVGNPIQTSVSNIPSHIPSGQPSEAVTALSQSVPDQNQLTAAQQPQTSVVQQQQQQQQQSQQHQQQHEQQQQATDGQQQQQQPYQQPPPHQGSNYSQSQDQYNQFQQQPTTGQWYDRRALDPYYNRQYYDYRNQQYEYYARQAAYDRQRAYRAYRESGYDARTYSRQDYTNPERPRSRQGYTDQNRQGYTDRERPRSRQGYQDTPRHGSYSEQENIQRPRSRQERGYSADGYLQGYTRKDPQGQENNRGYDAYSSKQAQDYWAKQGYYGNRSYDDRYQNWELQNQYKRDRVDDSQRQNTSAPEQQWAAETQTGGEDYQANQGDARFASEFHHQGGDTPEKYDTNQSGIYAQDYGNRNASGNAGYQDQYGTTYEYQYGSDGTYQKGKQATPPPVERLTPAKFVLPHVIARFSPGGHLIKVLPNMPQDGMPATVEIHSVETMLQHTVEAEELAAFPGPLVRGETHKSDVIGFAHRTSEACKSSIDMVDKDSAALLWDLLELLCRQNGNIMESDVSELLLKNHPMVTATPPATPASQTDEEPSGEETNTEGQRSGVITQKKHQLRDVESDTKRFRELLLFGRKKDALEAAIKSGLWGHALLLACKMDSRVHTSVMTRFANSLPMNDPLQTLYQLMSDRQPAAVTSCADEKWGDWRPHLAMVLSNLSQDSDLDVKSITTLGDSLASRGLVKASHFVYLMAQVGFGVFSKKTTKMVLLGASHSLPFKSFAMNECIQQTEVYEYAQLLANKQYTLSNYQPYKFIYATRLAEYGFNTQALDYCEVVGNVVLNMPTLFSATLVNQICQLAERLVYHDERYLNGKDVELPYWLRRLQDTLNLMNDGQILPSSSSGTPMPWVESYSNLSTMAESIDSSGPTFEVSNTDGREPTAVGDYTLTASGYYQPATSTAGLTNDPSQIQHDTYSYDQQSQFTQDNVGATSAQYSDNYTNFGQSSKPLSALPQNLDPGASLNSNYSEYSTTSATSAGDSGTEFEESGASKAAFDYYGTSTRTASFSQYSAKQAGSPPSPADTLTPPATPGGRVRTFSTDSTKQPQGEEEKKQEPKPEAKEKPKEKHKPKQGGGRGWFGGFFSKVVGRGNQVHLPDDSKKSIEWDEKRRKWVDTNADEDECDAPPPAPPTDLQLNTSSAPSTVPQMGGPGKFRKPAKRNYVDVLNQSSSIKSLSISQAPSSLFQTLPTGPPSTNMNYFVPAPVADDGTDSNQQQPQIGNPASRSETPATPASHSEQQQQQQQQQQQFFNPNAFGNSASINPSTEQYAPPQATLPAPQEENLSRCSSSSSLSREVSHLMQEKQANIQEEPTSQAPPSTQAPPPTQPAAPMFFNPQSYPSQVGGPSVPPSGSAPGSTKRGYGARRQYPSAR